MEITEIRNRLVNEEAERLKAFCTVVLDNEFVVRDIKIIAGPKGLFVAMPSRKLTDHCHKCSGKNHLRAKYCNECGVRLSGQRVPDMAEGGGKLHVDVAHPINSECRGRFQDAIISAYRREMESSKKAGYVALSLDVDDVPKDVQKGVTLDSELLGNIDYTKRKPPYTTGLGTESCSI